MSVLVTTVSRLVCQHYCFVIMIQLVTFFYFQYLPFFNKFTSHFFSLVNYGTILWVKLNIGYLFFNLKSSLPNLSFVSVSNIYFYIAVNSPNKNHTNINSLLYSFIYLTYLIVTIILLLYIYTFQSLYISFFAITLIDFTILFNTYVIEIGWLFCVWEDRMLLYTSYSWLFIKAYQSIRNNFKFRLFITLQLITLKS